MIFGLLIGLFFLFLFILFITQTLGLAGSRNKEKEYKTGRMTLPTKDQIKIAIIGTILTPIVLCIVALIAHLIGKK